MNPFTFRTKPQGMWANFRSDCFRCNGEVTVSHGRVDPHDCRESLNSQFAPNSGLDLEQILAALDNRN